MLHGQLSQTSVFKWGDFCDFRSAHVKPANGYDDNKNGWTLDRFSVENDQMVR